MSISELARVSRPAPDTSRRDPSAPFRHVDALLIFAALALAGIGVLMVFSATKGAEGPADTSYLLRQGMFCVIGSGLMVAVSLIDYRKLADWAPFIYGGSILLLLAVISPLGSESKGAQAWFGFGPFQLQPAEFAKLAMAVGLGALLASWDGDIDLRRLAVALGVAGLPMGLILLQPDLGTVLVFVAMAMAMLLVGGVKGRHILVLALIGVAGVVGVFNSNTLDQYQEDRLTAFLDTESGQASTYNVEQSVVAVGNGGLTGEGLFEGDQTQADFVPEQQTDFIFTVVAEELGFIGSATVLGLYAIVLWRVWRAAQLARDAFGRLICAGILAMFAFQVFESVGMATNIMPVTGIPLPLLSYGGSSALTSFLAIGIVNNVHMRRFR